MDIEWSIELPHVAEVSGLDKLEITAFGSIKFSKNRNKRNLAYRMTNRRARGDRPAYKYSEDYGNQEKKDTTKPPYLFILTQV